MIEGLITTSTVVKRCLLRPSDGPEASCRRATRWARPMNLVNVSFLLLLSTQFVVRGEIKYYTVAATHSGCYYFTLTSSVTLLKAT